MNKSEQLTHQVFDSPEFGRMRILQEGEKYLFCAIDAASALGYVNPRAALQRHCTPLLLAAFKACPTLLRAICTG